MKQQRKKIESLKKKFGIEVKKIINKYQKSVILELEYKLKKSGYKSINTILKELSPHQKWERYTNEIIQNYQKELAEIWNNYFGIEPNSIDTAKIMASYNIDFDNIKKEINNKIKSILKNFDNEYKSFSKFRTELVAKGIARTEATTLANTALSGYDNNLMLSYAKEAGVKKFIYDGVLHPNSREFCRQHLGKSYTENEILQLDNGQGLPVITHLGGYNCTHYWTPEV